MIRNNARSMPAASAIDSPILQRHYCRHRANLGSKMTMMFKVGLAVAAVAGSAQAYDGAVDCDRCAQ